MVSAIIEYNIETYFFGDYFTNYKLMYIGKGAPALKTHTKSSVDWGSFDLQTPSKRNLIGVIWRFSSKIFNVLVWPRFYTFDTI